MIRVEPPAEPSNFDQAVRQPGRAWLERNPDRPTTELPSHWRKVLRPLAAGFHDTCAYSGLRVELTTGAGTVDHFLPKSRHPQLAYEWSNYRFASMRMNGRKGDATDVMDPFDVQPGDFELVFDVPLLIVRAGAHVDEERRRRVNATIDRLGLNDEPVLHDRTVPWAWYLQREITLTHLKRFAAFVAAEAERQGRLAAS